MLLKPQNIQNVKKPTSICFNSDEKSVLKVKNTISKIKVKEMQRKEEKHSTINYE